MTPTLTPEEILRMARDAGYDLSQGRRIGEVSDADIFRRFAALVAAHERELCAVAAEKQARWIGYNAHAEAVAAVIRARGNV